MSNDANVHTYRDDTRDVIASLLTTYIVSTNPDEVKRMTKDLERGVFNRSIKAGKQMRITQDWGNPLFKTLYKTVYRSVIANLDPECYVNNKKLIERLSDLENPLVPHDIPFMKPENIYADRWNDIVKLTKERDHYLMNARPAAMTDQFKCSRCKGRECSYIELQTRSCDEPASIFITCHGCGNKWRIG